MAAPRQYSDAQRAAMFRLYEAGKTPAEIARLCQEGTAGVSPFSIPRRTCHDIVTRMAEEAERKLPTSVAEAESAEAVERFPVRIARLVDAEITRLTTKQEKGGLTVGDYEKLERAAKLSHDLEKRLKRRPAPTRRGGKGTREGTGPSPEPESALERLAREQQEGETGQVHVGHAHTRHDEDEETAEPATASPYSEPPESADVPSLDERREEAAQRARAALAAG